MRIRPPRDGKRLPESVRAGLWVVAAVVAILVANAVIEAAVALARTFVGEDADAATIVGGAVVLVGLFLVLLLAGGAALSAADRRGADSDVIRYAGRLTMRTGRSSVRCVVSPDAIRDEDAVTARLHQARRVHLPQYARHQLAD